MKASKVLSAVFAMGIVSACFFALAACTAPVEENIQNDEVIGLTGGVAGTVNGTEIMEDTLTTWIQNYRKTSNLLDQDAWGQWLADSDYTPETIRQDIFDYFTGQELIRQAAEEKGIAIESSEIDGYVSKTRANYATEEKWQEALAVSGTTEEAYRADIEVALLEQRIKEAVAAPEGPTDEELLEYAQMYATAYDGAKRSSHILFDSTNEATAQEVLDRINAGELDFAEAAKEYSMDTASAEVGGDVGWDKTTSFVQEYTDALAALELNQVSGLVPSTYGIHIIKCTDVFSAPGEVTSMDQIPAEFVEAIKTSLESSKKNDAFSTWYTEFKEAAEIVVNPMPEQVPYNVDMSQFQAADSEADASADGTTGDEAVGEADAASDGTEQPEASPSGQGEVAGTEDAADPAPKQPTESS